MRLRFSAVLPHVLDLRQAAVRVRKLLTEKGAELVEDLSALAFAPRVEEAKHDRVTFETPAGGKVRGKVEFRVRGKMLEANVRLDQVRLDAPRFCAEDLTELESELVVGDGQQSSLRLLLREAWVCERRQNGQVRRLKVSAG